eukprot:CAMPEP_0118815146 /NCGR_PEP_ID=MMETSP1162-20130426/4005_1 /TAXON_ID=33656 /ORGANISM="Phaeocystis Sp, Strain CCMP2710" /LENGTH=92 /DNA_ID=CAMNT_0006745081 /DNA_START=215 /DNA_END=493 /DNA_ORIENTATION=+
MDNLQAGVTATPLAADADVITTATGLWTTRLSFRLSWRRSFRHGLPVLSSSVEARGSSVDPAREPRARARQRRSADPASPDRVVEFGDLNSW